MRWTMLARVLQRVCRPCWMDVLDEDGVGVEEGRASMKRGELSERVRQLVVL